jgi:DNA-binding transcriptional regulator GbsR (MarR family)
MSENTPIPAEVLEAQRQVAEIFGNIATFWGFPRTQGRVYGLLFVSPTPLAHADIRERLEISAGSASMTLASLIHWGVLRRDGRLYEAQTDMMKVIKGVLRRREGHEVDTAIERMQTVAALLEAASKAHQSDTRATAIVRFAHGRVCQLLDFFKLGRRFLDALVAESPLHDLLGALARRAASFRLPFSGSGKDVYLGSH